MMHSNLADGLRQLGHEVTLVSHGYGWRRFPGQDVVLERRRDINGKLSFLLYLWQVLRLLPTWRGYDVVQLSHCSFLELRGRHVLPFYRFLRRHNRKIVMCSCDVDYHILDQVDHHDALRYSEFKVGDELRRNSNIDPLREQYEEVVTPQGTRQGWNTELSRYVSRDCDAIVPILYEYWTCYDKVYPEKTRFIPLPILPAKTLSTHALDAEFGDRPVRLFIGLQRDRMLFKGTDILLRAAQDTARVFPDMCTLQIAENVPYAEYERLMNDSDVLIDQLYSYTPAMNALIAMSKGLVVVSGGEPENYEILQETELRPIINVLPTYESCCDALRDLITHRERIPMLKRQSLEYVRRHHDYLKVARQYADLYESI